ncbi:MAG: hypothetical protein WBQ16_05490 [Nitrososphaeraceae archaeon]
MYKKYTAVISLSFIVSAAIAATILQLNYAYAQKAETLDFLETVRNIAHDDVFVQLRITGGTTQNFTIDGNPSNIDAPTIQIVKFTLPRQSTTPGILPLKIGDGYFACLSLKGTEASCLRSTIDSLTIAQAKALDVKVIPQ